MTWSENDWTQGKAWCPHCMRDEVGFAIELKQVFFASYDDPVPDIYQSIYFGERRDETATKRLSLFEECVSETLRSFFLGDPTGSHISVSFFICAKCHSSSLKAELAYIEPADLEEDVPSWGYDFHKKRIGDLILTPIRDGMRRQAQETELFSDVDLSEESNDDPLVNTLRIYARAREEVIRSIAANLNLVATAGLRLMIDVLVSHRYSGHSGDGGSFRERIKKLRDNGIIDEASRLFLSKLVDWGNKAAHSGQKLDRQHIITSIIHLDRIAAVIIHEEKIHGSLLETNPRRIKIKKPEPSPKPDGAVIPFPKNDDSE